MQGPVKILIANVRIGLYGNLNSVIYPYEHLLKVNRMRGCGCWMSSWDPKIVHST